jgi:hypothetical protein
MGFCKALKTMLELILALLIKYFMFVELIKTCKWLFTACRDMNRTARHPAGLFVGPNPS